MKDPSAYIGLDLYRARKMILHDFSDITEQKIEVRYVEASPSLPRWTVLSCRYDGDCIELEVASDNPIRHLPSIYQDFEKDGKDGSNFLRGFLMIFQHIFNETALTLDNMHNYFRPMESPAGFLPALADWLGIQLDTLNGEAEIRRFLQYAIPLYRCRGTARGLRAHLYIVSGVAPDIIEGEIPYTPLLITDGAGITAYLFDEEPEPSDFTVYFPKPRRYFTDLDDSLIRRLSLIVRREKPVYTRAYLSFADSAEAPRQETLADIEWEMPPCGDLNGIV
jgi:phage tail-like protein